VTGGVDASKSDEDGQGVSNQNVSGGGNRMVADEDREFFIQVANEILKRMTIPRHE
jgi:hypothetical protein